MSTEKQRKRAERAARKEAQKFGYEYRPNSASDTDVARRLSEGFGLLSEADDAVESEDDDDT